MRVGETAVVIIYLALLIGAGIFFRKMASRSSEDYWVAGRELPAYVACLGLLALSTSGSMIIGGPGIVYKMGWSMGWGMTWGAAFGLVAAAILIAMPLRNSGVVSIGEFMNRRYNHPLTKILFSVLLFVGLLGYIIGNLKAATLGFVYLSGVSYVTALTVVMLVFTLYILLGGMWAAGWIDLFQGAMVLLLLAVMAPASLIYFGGFSELVVKSAVEIPRIAGINFPYISYLGAFFNWFIAFAILPHLVMRVLSTKTNKGSRWALNMTALLFMGFTVIFCAVVGTAGIRLDPTLKDADYVFYNLLAHIVGSPVVRGIIMSCVFAAIISTVAGLLLSAAAILSNDIYAKWIRPKATQKEMVMVGRIGVIFCALVCWILSVKPPQFVVVAIMYGIAVMGCGLFFPIVLGIWWKRVNVSGAVAGILSGTVVYLYFQLATKVPMFSPVIYGLLVSLALTVAVSLITPAPVSKSQQLTSGEGA